MWIYYSCFFYYVSCFFTILPDVSPGRSWSRCPIGEGWVVLVPLVIIMVGGVTFVDVETMRDGKGGVWAIIVYGVFTPLGSGHGPGLGVRYGFRRGRGDWIGGLV